MAEDKTRKDDIAEIRKKAKSDAKNAAHLTAVTEYVENLLSPEEKDKVKDITGKYSVKLPGLLVGAEMLAKRSGMSDEEIKKFSEELKTISDEELTTIRDKLNKGGLSGEVQVMKDGFLNGVVLKYSDLEKASTREGIERKFIDELKPVILEQAVKDRAKEVLSEEYLKKDSAQNGDNIPSFVLPQNISKALDDNLNATPEYYDKYGKAVAGIQAKIKNSQDIPKIISTAEKEIAEGIKGGQYEKEIAQLVIATREKISKMPDAAMVTVPEEPAPPLENKLAAKNPNSPLNEDEFTAQLKNALLGGAIAGHVLGEAMTKHPEISQGDKNKLQELLGIDGYAKTFTQIQSKLPDSNEKMLSKEEFLKNVPAGALKNEYERFFSDMESMEKVDFRQLGGLKAKYSNVFADMENNAPKYRKMSPKEDFLMGGAGYMKEINAQIYSGMHNEKIAELNGKISGILDKYRDKLIEKARTELKEVASGSALSGNFIESLERLQKNHGLGAEVLDSGYNDPAKPHKTAEEMQKIANYSIKSGGALYKAHEALDGIKSGKIDAKEGIKTINKQLSEQGFGYDRLDKTFDPSNPDFSKTADEMKWKIKQAVSHGNYNRLELIKLPENKGKYKKPDFNLEGDKLFEAVDALLNVKANSIVAKSRFDEAKTGKISAKVPDIAVTERKETTSIKPSEPAKNVEQKKANDALVKKLKGLMLNDEIRTYVFNELVKKYPDLPYDKRRILDELLVKDFDSAALDKEKTIAAKQGIDEKAFFRAYDTAKKQIPNENSKKIERLKKGMQERVDEDVIDQHIREVRKTLDQVASGHSSSFSLRSYLKNYDLEIRVLDPNYDRKKPDESPTNAQMEKTLAPLFKKGDALNEAREALYQMEIGKIDVKTSIEDINGYLSSAGLGYDALDPKFDLRKPNDPHKTSKEMKDVIKAAAEKGNVAAEEERKRILDKDGKEPPYYTYQRIPAKPDRSLDLDKLLNLPEGKKTSANPADDKFAAIMKDVQISPLIAYNESSFVAGAPQNGRGGQVLA